MFLHRLFPLTLLTLPSICMAVDLQPNGIIAPLPGDNHVIVSYVNAEGGGFLSKWLDSL
jgi:hypothetical protein